MIRPARAVLSAITLILGFALAAPAAAAAAPHASAGTCNGSAYPPSPHAQIQASTTTPSVGQTIKASGSAYCPDEDVRVTLAGSFVATTHTDGTGAFDPTSVKVGKTGKLRLCGVGASGLANDRDCLVLTVESHGVAGQPPAHGGGGTSFTGVDVLLIVIGAVVLLGAGAGFVVAGRRKRRVAV